jgi:hypothetical protein
MKLLLFCAFQKKLELNIDYGEFEQLIVVSHMIDLEVGLEFFHLPLAKAI